MPRGIWMNPDLKGVHHPDFLDGNDSDMRTGAELQARIVWGDP